jgi:coenzyme F420-0:L-glutamate ligase/coenzyme F420-1:gamma-L-glutamate ligase
MIQLVPLNGLPIIEPGDDLCGLLCQSLESARPQNGDILVVTSKIVSKAEGRFEDLKVVSPSDEAIVLAIRTGHDARLVELVLRESQSVSRASKGVLITRHRLGFVSANAGIDRSNVGVHDDVVLLLPINPDASAMFLQKCLCECFHLNKFGVILADSHGRPHRLGTVGVAIGVAGMPGIEDWRGREDLFGFKLQHTEIGLADMVASAATLMMGQAAESIPAVLVRGVQFSKRDGNAKEIYRPPQLDLYG